MSEERQADEIELSEPQTPRIDDSKSAPEDRAEAGPFDASEVPAMRPYVDLGGIKVAPREGLQLRLEVDERANRVVAVSLDYAESLLQVQAFAAPKSTGLWHGVRAELAQQMASQGASLVEEDGPLGTELGRRCRPTRAAVRAWLASSRSTVPAGCCAASSWARPRSTPTRASA
jgi:hypothetical protein